MRESALLANLITMASDVQGGAGRDGRCKAHTRAGADRRGHCCKAGFRAGIPLRLVCSVPPLPHGMYSKPQVDIDRHKRLRTNCTSARLLLAQRYAPDTPTSVNQQPTCLPCVHLSCGALSQRGEAAGTKRKAEDPPDEPSLYSDGKPPAPPASTFDAILSIMPAGYFDSYDSLEVHEVRDGAVASAHQLCLVSRAAMLALFCVGLRSTGASMAGRWLA